MGIAILEVLIAHSFDWLNFPNKFSHLASKMVFTQGFLLLSGLGLYYSYSKNQDIIRFYLRRIQRMWFPYMIKVLSITIPFFIIMYLIKNENKFINEYYCIAEKLLLIPIICYIANKIKFEKFSIYKILSWFGKYTLKLYVLHLMIKQALTLSHLSFETIVPISIGSSILLCQPCSKITQIISYYIIPDKK